MILEPKNRISGRALKVWRISGAFYSVMFLLLAGGITALTIIFDWPLWISAAAIILFLISIYFFVMLFPSLRWKRWRYEVREQEIELQHGLFVIKRTLVPMVRVQHVDTAQGPLLRKYNLATVTVSTAATTHEIPALELSEAEEMRVYISRLARVADEDV
ncbi:PH domain-containing protein [Bacillus tuaregi]|uniref:PH domain-containing protein n=1 Tax=Bacillus tuaregi TaxID=1816695 RepID=UPI0008F94268|nr:PH domain-containing protein [Bacillus tuaregi]